MNKVGTKKYQEYIKSQEKILINLENASIIELESLKQGFNIASHGIGIYDIRYQILKNPNWSLKEKKN